MSAWSDLMESVNDACIENLGGETGTYEPQSGANFALEFIRTDPPQMDGESLPATYIAVFVKAASFVDVATSRLPPAKGDLLTIDAADPYPYRVFHIKPDQGGGVILTLTK